MLGQDEVDNLEVEILSNLNELAKRHRLRPSDFRAEFREHTGQKCHTLVFTSPAAADENMTKRYRTMLLNLGIRPGEQELIGNASAIAKALDHALSQTPTTARGR